MWHSLISLLMRQEFKSSGAGNEPERDLPADAPSESLAEAAIPLESIQIPSLVSFAECAGLMFTDGLEVGTDPVS